MPEDDVFPDRGMSHRDKVVFMLEREGWALDAVPSRADLDPPFPRYAYTIGLEDRFAFPELCVVGLSPSGWCGARNVPNCMRGISES